MIRGALPPGPPHPPPPATLTRSRCRARLRSRGLAPVGRSVSAAAQLPYTLTRCSGCRHCEPPTTVPQAMFWLRWGLFSLPDADVAFAAFLKDTVAASVYLQFGATSS